MAGFTIAGSGLSHAPHHGGGGNLVLLFPRPGLLRASAYLVSLLARRGSTAALGAVVPLRWIFEAPNPLWKKALDTRTYYYLYKWTWYEWLGALAPLILFWTLWRVARKQNETALARFSLAVFAYGIFQQAVAMLMLGFPSLVRLTPFQPMRYLQLVYFFLALLSGCLLGKYLLKPKLGAGLCFCWSPTEACLPLNAPSSAAVSTLSGRAAPPATRGFRRSPDPHQDSNRRILCPQSPPSRSTDED